MGYRGQLVLGTNEQQMAMPVYLDKRYPSETALNANINAMPLRKTLNEKDRLKNPQ